MLGANQQDPERASHEIDECRPVGDAAIDAEPKHPGIHNGGQSQRRRQWPKAMQQRGQSEGHPNKGGVLPVREPLDKTQDREKPQGRGANPGRDVRRSQSPGDLFRVTLSAKANVGHEAHGFSAAQKSDLAGRSLTIASAPPDEAERCETEERHYPRRRLGNRDVPLRNVEGGDEAGMVGRPEIGRRGAVAVCCHRSA